MEKIAYWTYVPRFEYSIWKYKNKTNIKFISSQRTETDSGYSIPASFNFNGKELKGYWVSKYKIKN